MTAGLVLAAILLLACLPGVLDLLPPAAPPLPPPPAPRHRKDRP